MNRSLVAIAALLLIFSMALCNAARAASSALIVTGLSGSAENLEEFQRLAMETKRLLVERGIPVDQIKVMGGKVTRDEVLKNLEAAATGSAGDEFWFVIYGHGGRTQGGVPTLQVSGPRLTVNDLKTALDAIPARQFVFIGAGGSGGFLPILQNNRRAVLSATKADGEGDWPRFPSAWVNAFGENPKAAFTRIAARTAALVEEEYNNNRIAQGEHARLADPVTGTILEPPFGVNLTAEKEITQAGRSSAPLPSASEIKIDKVEINNKEAEWELQPATAETKKIVADARAVANPEGHSALVLEQRIGFTVEEDRTTDELIFWRALIVRDEAVADWANQIVPQYPPTVTTKLEIARVIHPDGSAMVFNPSRIIASTDPSGGPGAQAMVILPNAKAGCVIEFGYRTRELLNSTLPHISETIPLLRSAPSLKTSLEIRVPEKPLCRVLLKNVPAEVRESSEGGRHVYRWQIGALPAMEPLPGDPPWTQWAAYAAISSLPTWDEFVEWYRRLAKGSDEIDDKVEKRAAQLADGTKSRLEIIRRDFEFVSALRYVAIEMGVQGFRPRPPSEVLVKSYGDCKDKANLLVALLKCQGIEANFVLLNRGGQTDVTFPSWQFNHAMVFVPRAPNAGQPDELWLDSTDSVTPFGFVPPGDFGRAGLVLGRGKPEFKTVSGCAAMVTEIRDEWTLEQDARNGWRGSFHRQTTGLADDMLRRVFRSLTPAQRRMQIYRMLGELWDGGDFTRVTVSDVSALRNGVELNADVAGTDGLPRIAMPGLEIFSAPERDRVLWLNDGQPLALTQTLRLRYTNGVPEKLPAPLQLEVAGEKLSVVWNRVDALTVTRIARLELPQPVIAACDYSPFRKAIREWNAALAH